MTEPVSISATLQMQQQAAKIAPYPSLQQRKQKLLKLKQLLQNNQTELCKAVSDDFGHRSIDETKMLEIFPSLQAIKYTLKNLNKWMQPKKRKAAIWFTPTKLRIIPQPLGVVGIIVPWNYPIYLALAPLIGAIAAGNRVMLKLSEYVPATSELLKKLLHENFDRSEISVFTGGPEVAQEFSRQAYDHLLVTSSGAIGKAVMRAASENLTPVTLELGGKSPVIIDSTADLAMAADRIIVGKMLNAGQTCVAPDYVLLPKDKLDEFIVLCQQITAKRYPNINNNDDYSSIINQKNYQRLQTLLADAKQNGAKIIICDEENSNTAKLALHILSNVNDDTQIMQQEIFGPLLPILTYDDRQQAIDYIKNHPRPLALYYFGKDKTFKKQLLRDTHAGGVAINTTLMHAGMESLPFGGVGASGMGHYHGYEGFCNFSKLKPVLYQGKFSSFGLMYPPYNKFTKTLLNLISK